MLYEMRKGRPSDLDGACVAIGVFDGLHLGHRDLIGASIDDARKEGDKSAIITFDMDPDELFKDSHVKIMGDEERMDLLAGTDADAVAAIHFDRETASMGPEDFLEAMFGKHMPSSIHVGSDFKFGNGRTGDVCLLTNWAEGRGAEVHIHPLLEIDGRTVKSTLIRELLSNGDVRGANELLGSPYTICGTVKHGRAQGSQMGIATANVDADCILLDGVYAGYAILEGSRYKAAINVGIPPTFKNVAKSDLEAHILDFSGDLYGKSVCLSFIERLRPEMDFPSTDALVSQVRSDIEHIRNGL